MSHFPIEPNKTETYELLFSPLREFKSKGSIAFIHDKLGEIWYELDLTSERNIPIKLPIMKSELGKVITQEIELENPSNMDVKVKIN